MSQVKCPDCGELYSEVLLSGKTQKSIKILPEAP